MTDKGFNDEALILKVKNWQTTQSAFRAGTEK